MTILISFIRFVSFGFFVVLLTACGEGGGNDNGDPSDIDGGNTTSMIDRVILPGQECPTGGVEIDTGIDSNGNGMLDDDEVLTSEVVCNGLNGSNSLVSFDSIAPNQNCELGGIQVNTGIDSDNNGELHTSEITDTEYLCSIGEVMRPSVVSAKSLSNTQVLIAFSQQMGSGAEDANSYTVVQESVNPEAGSLAVITAEYYDSNQTSVLLTTLSQNELTYRITVTNIYGSNGLAMAPTQISGGVILNPSSALFAGSPPNLNSLSDSDNDGLYDHEEQRGWYVSVLRTDGSVEVREVTSDPFEPDTDGDGLDDALELNLRSDPRDPDTDDDQLNDAYEFNALFTDLTRQDTDGDGLSDNAEVEFYLTSPVQVDTDGDQINDDVEILLAARNARVADLPQPSIEIISTDLQLDIRFEESDQTGTRDLESRSVSSTLTQSEEKKSARTRSSSDEVTAKASVEQTYSSSGGAGAGFPKFSTVGTLEAGTTHNWSSSWTEESSRSSQDEYAKSLNTEAEVSEESVVTRRVDGASIKAAVMLGSLGDIAFNIRDIQISALVPDERNPGVYLPIATLVPENPDGADLANSYTLGPLIAERGPIIFTNRDVFPAQVERLMKDPTGVIFKISNYNISDEFDRNFAFTSQDVIDRTTLLSIDFGTRDTDGDGVGDGSELYRVATSLGTAIGEVVDLIALEEGLTEEEVRASFGLDSDDTESLVTYDLKGRALGVKFHDIMQNVLGFTRYNEDSTPTNSLNSTEQGNSYSTRVSNGIEHIVRIRQTCNNEVTTCADVVGSFRRWATLTEDGLLVGGDLSFSKGDAPKPRDDTLLPGKAVTLAYVQDQDLDGIPARLEVMHGCDDGDMDSDDDGLDDRLEVFGAAKDENGFLLNPQDKWEINISGRGSYEGFSGCGSTESDGDGLTDAEEYEGFNFDLDDNAGISDFSYAFTNTSTRYQFVNAFPEYSQISIPSVRADSSNFRIQNVLTGEEIPVTSIGDYQDGGIRTLVVNHTDTTISPSFRRLYFRTRSLNYWWNEQPDGGFLPQGRLDAKNSDTDEDGISDYDELNGYRIDLYFAREASSQCEVDPASDAPINGVICRSDPLNPDSDGDTLPDGLEITLRADPSFDDGEDVIDLDGDGLIGREEERGWPVTVTWFDSSQESGNEIIETTCAGSADIGNDCRVHEGNVVASSVSNRDTDGDGLSDSTERDYGTHPDDVDSDNDGRTDFEEIIGYAANDLDPDFFVTSNPLHFDTDGDDLSDGDELTNYNVGPVFDEDGVNLGTEIATSDPNGESDSDGLKDSLERQYNTHARLNDTDGDGLNDRNELIAGSDPLRADQVCVEIFFSKVTLSQTGTCDGTGSNTGAEIFGILDAQGQGTRAFPYIIDKKLIVSSTSSLPTPDLPSYALLDSTNDVRFRSLFLAECDGTAEGKSDGEIGANCQNEGLFSGIDFLYTYDDHYKMNQLEVTVPQIATQVEVGAECRLEFSVSVKPVTDSLIASDIGDGFYCGGIINIED